MRVVPHDAGVTGTNLPPTNQPPVPVEPPAPVEPPVPVEPPMPFEPSPSETPRKHRWNEFREWTNIGVAVTALLLAIVTFVNSGLISDLENYLRSEISRRNSELDAMSARAKGLQVAADMRADRLADLQATTDSLLSQALASQAQLFDNQARLSSIQSEVLAARLQLSEAQQETGAVRDSLLSQTRSLDLLQRRQAYEHAALMVLYSDFDVGSGRGDLEGAGQAIVAVLQNMTPPTGRQALAPYLHRIRTNFERACPTIAAWRPNLLPQAIPPDQPTIQYRQGTSQARINELTVAAQQQWNAEFAEYRRKEREYSERLIDERQRLWAMAQQCVCSSLADEQFSQADICPGAARSAGNTGS